MCCGLRLHVIIISLFGIMFSGFLHFTWNFKPYESHLIFNKDTKTTKPHENNVAILLRCLKFLEYINLFSNICSLIGAIKYKKYLLIPYMIINLIWILLVLACSLLLLILGLELTGDGLIKSIEKEEDLTSYLTVLIPMATSLGIYLYGFVIVVLFYKAISSGDIPCRNTVAVSRGQMTNRGPIQTIESSTPSLISPFGMTAQSLYETERTQRPERPLPPSYYNDPPPPYSYERQPPKNPFV